jgi:hypothetical protein
LDLPFSIENQVKLSGADTPAQRLAALSAIQSLTFQNLCQQTTLQTIGRIHALSEVP